MSPSRGQAPLVELREKNRPWHLKQKAHPFWVVVLLIEIPPTGIERLDAV